MRILDQSSYTRMTNKKADHALQVAVKRKKVKKSRLIELAQLSTFLIYCGLKHLYLMCT